MMKKMRLVSAGVWKASVLLLLFFNLFTSCEMFRQGGGEYATGEGELRISFTGLPDSRTKSDLDDIPDTSDFLLKVVNEDGEVLYDGVYGDCPESMMVEAGSYTVTVISEDFSKPEFSAPQFGDEQCVVVPSGGVANVNLTCYQLNCGVRLRIDASFLDAFPDGVLFLKSADGRLMYGYKEKRIAYFKPGKVLLVLNDADEDKTLLTKTLNPQEVLTLSVSASVPKSSSEKENVSVAVDTTRVWLEEEYVIGGSNGKGDDADDALTVSQAKEAVGAMGVWVSGYIVGGDLSSSSASFEEPFSSRTNIVLGPKSSTQDREECLAVQLSSGSVRDALNLVDNSTLLGRKVSLKGDIVDAYYGINGVKNVTDYELL